MAKLTWEAGDILPQIHCPLFTRLPAEIRIEIFEYALTAFDDTSNPYREDDYFFRPGYEYRQVLSTTLPQTCRHIYCETRLLSALVNELVGWYTTTRAPPPKLESANSIKKDLVMTREQFSLTRIHLHTQQYWLESRHFIELLKRWKTSPRSLHITWFWESGAALAFNPKKFGQPTPGVFGAEDPFARGSWGLAFRHIPDLQEFKLELETVVPKKAELANVVSHASTWKFPSADGKYLKLNEGKTISTSWLGPKVYNSYHELPFLTRALTRVAPNNKEKQEFIVTTLTWVPQAIATVAS
ncbi:MAG: hypothetical protein MMC33_009867 [Icmadophila ericetorum]|nr:hypothetical protein [Icmadophila ericetorum]